MPSKNNNKYHRMSKSLIICWRWRALSSIKLWLVWEDPIWRGSWHYCTKNFNKNIIFQSFTLKFFSKMTYRHTQQVVLALEQSQLVGVGPLDTLQHKSMHEKFCRKRAFSLIWSQRYIVPQPKEMMRFTYPQLAVC